MISAFGPGQIVDIRWGSQFDRQWLRENLSAGEVRELAALPQWIRREMSVFRCSECGQVGAYDGIGEDALLIWSLKGCRCSACYGCDCEECRHWREVKA